MVELDQEVTKLGHTDWFYHEPSRVPEALADIFEEVPVDLDTFIKDSAFLNADWDLSPIQYEAIRTIERVYYDDLYPLMGEVFDSDYWREPIKMKNLITLEWGKGSGKDLVCRLSSARVAYLLLCLRSPQNYFGIPEEDSIHLLNIAKNASQAREAFFVPLKNIVRRGWFKGKARISRESIIYAKNIIAISGNSDAESQEGLNIILGVADEIDAFREKDEMIGLASRKREASTSAESILKMLKGSASTRFPETYKRVAISYPRYIGSTIQKQIEEAKIDIERYGDDDSIYYASGPHPTWDVNPRIKGKEAYASDYRKDPIEAASMYECKPARAVDGYFQNMPAIKQAIDRQEQPVTFTYAFEPIKSDETGETVKVWNVHFNFSETFKPKQGVRYAMHADLAIKGDRAGVAMTHIEKWLDKTEEDYNPDTGSVTESLVRVPVLRNDFVIGFEASKSTKDPETGEPAPREIQIRWARQLAFELIRRGFLIVMFSFDGFQSADSMQILNSHGVETDRISADINDAPYKALKDVAYDGRLHMPYSQLLLDELSALNRVGKKIDHPPGGSKDLADALCCSIVGAIGAMGEETVDGKEVDTSAQKFAVGEALAPLAGMDNSLLSMMPIGMEGQSLYG